MLRLVTDARREPGLQALAGAPEVLVDEDAAEVGEGVRASLERLEDRLPVAHVERDDAGAPVERTLQVVGVAAEVALTEPADELDDVLVGDGDACQPHRSTIYEHVFVCQCAGRMLGRH